MEGELKIYQINLHKCEGAQSNLMVELANIKEEHTVRKIIRVKQKHVSRYTFWDL